MLSGIVLALGLAAWICAYTFFFTDFGHCIVVDVRDESESDGRLLTGGDTAVPLGR